MSDYRPFVIIDETQEGSKREKPEETKPLSEEFGRNLDTIEKARLWLTNPNNWHESSLYILKWNGLLCTVQREHGERLTREPWDDGLPWAAVYGQKRRRASSGSLGTYDEQELTSDQDSSS